MGSPRVRFERLSPRLPGLAALVLLPWLALLVACGETWWVVLDALEFSTLSATHILLKRRTPAARWTACAAALLLGADALADVGTAAPGIALASALIMALCVELPLAAVCLTLARGAAPTPRPSVQASTSHQSPLRLPGLLQTQAYATAWEAGILRRGSATQAQADEGVAFPLTRQQCLDRSQPPAIHAVLDESCLLRPIGGSDVMIAQLHHLESVATSWTGIPTPFQRSASTAIAFRSRP
ncbi:DUF5753 domain-containing protein [Kitasatospora sp. NBC_00240]|nr:DUF5753 domain-containing protein [Kitasatospora sp. NBC_00240]